VAEGSSPPLRSRTVEAEEDRHPEARSMSEAKQPATQENVHLEESGSNPLTLTAQSRHDLISSYTDLVKTMETNIYTHRTPRRVNRCWTEHRGG